MPDLEDFIKHGPACSDLQYVFTERNVQEETLDHAVQVAGGAQSFLVRQPSLMNQLGFHFCSPVSSPVVCAGCHNGTFPFFGSSCTWICLVPPHFVTEKGRL